MAAGNTESTAAQSADADLSDELVCEFLKDNCDFLQRHPEMMDYLQISHASGSAISLVEKQVSVLRERNMDMRHRLSALTGNARDNDKLYESTRELVLQLLETDSTAGLYKTFHKSMNRDFNVEHASMVLFSDETAPADYRTDTLANARVEIGPLLRQGKPVCGPLRKEELAYLFPDAGEVGSAALMPIKTDEVLGLLAIGSSDASRYGSGMGTMFLGHIADVIARLLPRLQRQDA